MRRLFPIVIAAGLLFAGLAAHVRARASAPPPASASIDAAFDDDGAMAPRAAPVASYTLYASLDPVKHTLDAKGTILWHNASPVAQNELFVHLYLNAFKNDRTYFMRFPSRESFRGGGGVTDWGMVTVKRFVIAGQDLWPGADKTSPGDPDDETDIRVPLVSPVEPGASVTIDVAFEARLPSLVFRTGHAADGFHMVAQWFPKIARLEPDGRFAHFAFHRLSEFYADFGDYDVTIDTPDTMVVGAVGQQEGEVREGGRLKRRFVQESVHDFAFAAWDRFRETTAMTDDGVALRVLFPPGNERAASRELSAARFGLRHFGTAFGRYPYKTLTLVHPPAGSEEAGGMEYPTLITTGGFWFLPWTGSRQLEILTLHELGHQWFYGLVATDEHAWPFLDEGVNSYAEVDGMEALFPTSSVFKAMDLSVGLSAVYRAVASELEANAPVAQPASAFATGGDYGGLVYSRTATILLTLGNVYGPDQVRRAVGRYARRYRFQHPGPADLLQAVREVVGEDAAEQLRVALFEQGTVDYAVSEILSEPDLPMRGLGGDLAVPRGPAAMPVEGYRGSALVRRRGTLRLPVDVELMGEDGSVQRVRWNAEEHAARLPWHGKSKLVGAVIDPEHRVLLDDDLSNNARRVQPRALSFPLLERLVFAASVVLSGVLP